MERILSFEQFTEYCKSKTNIYLIKNGRCYDYRVVGLDPFALSSSIHWILIERNTHEAISIREESLLQTAYFTGRYSPDFIENEIINYHKSKIVFHLSLMDKKEITHSIKGKGNKIENLTVINR